MSLLEIENLQLTINGRSILQDISLTINAGETIGLVGESGSGKSLTALTLMRLLPRGATASGRVNFNGVDILAASEDAMCALRGDDIGMVFQEPMTALNPVKTIGEQVAEGIRWHTRASCAEAEERTRKILDRVGLPQSKFPLGRYPHELSGGQRQRVVIAIATALKPKLLIADEPTTALDVVLQAQILDLLRELVAEDRMGLLLISHDLAVVADMSDKITILRGGNIMEAGETGRVLSEQAHSYTRRLALASMHCGNPAAMSKQVWQPQPPCSAYRTSAGSTLDGAYLCSRVMRRCAPSMMFRSKCSQGARSLWWAAPVAENRRWPASYSRWTSRLQGLSNLAVRESTRSTSRHCVPPGVTCRSYSRTPMGRSTPARKSRSWLPNRSICSMKS
jgi:ABC-type glutathione transport system ATPase component